jgi:tRNA pseudouridine32 synthase/23S rRNA pseudouridine746 synthase
MPEIQVIYSDDRIVAVEKPAGLLSVPGIGPENQDCAARRVESTFAGARIVHRLDRETSGVLLMALDAEARRHLGRQFEERRVAKRYIAIVCGDMAEAQGEIDLPMRKDMEARGPRHIVDLVQGRRALTRYRVSQRLPGRTRLELRPVTGRSHQLRVHLSSAGHPILGDTIYAPPDVAAMSGRLLLHAESLTVAHPGTGRDMTFECPCPF